MNIDKELSFLERHPAIKDGISLLIFIIIVILGTLAINSFIFRSFNVVGPSMENTLHTGDRLLVDRISPTWASIQNKPYIPNRGQIIVFKNPNYNPTRGDEYIVKRVIGLPGERVVTKNGEVKVYNSQYPNGHSYDNEFKDNIGYPSEGDSDITVPENQIFVAGDHRQGNFSFDSRVGMGTIPLYDVIGPVTFRFYPFTKIRTF